MENLKFTITSIIMVLVIAAIGFLAYMALEKGDESGLKQQVRELKNELAEKDETITDLERQIASLSVDLEGQQEIVAEQEQAAEEVKEETPATTEPSSSEHADLLAALQSLKSKGVVLEPGDSGSSVGTIQKFLNVYNNTSGGVDNDFGPGTRKKVETFQTNEGIGVDGGVGPGTLSTMIKWLSENS